MHAALLIACALTWSEPADILQSAETAYRNGLAARSRPAEARKHFAESARLYQQLVTDGADQPALFLNLGNAAFLADQLPEAILAYRRGLRRAPADRELQAHLAMARDQVRYPSARVLLRPEEESTSLMDPALVLLAAEIAFAAACIFATRWLTRRRVQALIAAMICLLLCTSLGGFWAWQSWRIASDAAYPLIVVAVEELSLQRGNGPTYAPHKEVPVVRRGMEGRRLASRGDWLQVEFPGGVVGWVPAEAVLQGN